MRLLYSYRLSGNERLHVNAAIVCRCHTEASTWNSLYSAINVMMNLQGAAE